MIRIFTLLGVGAALSFAAHAADIYRWVDENGRTHLADVVPDKYKATAVRVDSAQFEITPEQRREAQARVDREKATLAEQARASVPQGGTAPAGIGNASPASAPGSDCEALQRRYRESQECFAPFHNANGSLKVEANKVCKAVENPTVKCGSPKAY